jgi:hypothetical protein
MGMDVWYDVILRELVEANAEVNELLEDAEVVLEPDTTEDEIAV